MRDEAGPRRQGVTDQGSRSTRKFRERASQCCRFESRIVSGLAARLDPSESAQAMTDEHQPNVGTLPRSLPSGTDDYYRRRGADFVRRHPDREPPSYYLEYGEKCLHQFRAAQPDLSLGGQEWLELTLQLLQEAIEKRLRSDPAEFDRLELDDRGFRDFAFSTHAPAYVDGGILSLPASDLLRILKTPDLTAVVSPDGIAEILVMLAKLGRNDVAHILNSSSNSGTQNGAKRILGWILRHIWHPK